MSENTKRIFLSKDQAIAMLPQGQTIHVFRNQGLLLVGADWSRSEIIDLLVHSKTIEIGGSQCRALGHPIAAFDGEGYFFIEAILPEGIA